MFLKYDSLEKGAGPCKCKMLNKSKYLNKKVKKLNKSGWLQELKNCIGVL